MDNVEFKEELKNYELNYWKVNKGKTIDRSDVMLNMFDIDQMQIQIAADVGCGPLGGIFNSFKSPIMYAVDPMFKEYTKSGVLDIPNDVSLILNYTAEEFTLPHRADVIFSFNSLDHSGNIKISFSNIMSNLTDGGKFCFHIHLRTEAQLNAGHRMIITEEDIDNILAPYNIISKKVLDMCPLDNKPYKSYIAIVEN